MRKILAVIIIGLFCTSAHSATRIYKTVISTVTGGGDYTSLEACMNDNEQNLVTGDKYLDVEISGVWTSSDTNRLLLHNYTTDETHYINIYATGDAAWAGKKTTTMYINYPSENPLIYNGWIFFKNINFAKAISNIFSSMPADNIVEYDSCRAALYGVSAQTTPNKLLVKNCLVPDGIDMGAGAACRLYSYNSTWLGRAILRAGTTSYFTNNIMAADDAFLVYSGAVLEANYNALKENNSTDWTSGANNRVNQTFTFVSTTTENYHLTATDAGARDYGTSTVTGYPRGAYTVDVDVETRSGSWDIGMDEYVAASPPSALVPFLPQVMIWEN